MADEELGVGLVARERIARCHQDLPKQLQHHLLDLEVAEVVALAEEPHEVAGLRADEEAQLLHQTDAPRRLTEPVARMQRRRLSVPINSTHTPMRTRAWKNWTTYLSCSSLTASTSVLLTR
jgi:hypothetical protein